MKLFFYRKFIRFVIKHFTIVINNTIQLNGCLLYTSMKKLTLNESVLRKRAFKTNADLMVNPLIEVRLTYGVASNPYSLAPESIRAIEEMCIRDRCLTVVIESILCLCIHQQYLCIAEQADVQWIVRCIVWTLSLIHISGR